MDILLSYLNPMVAVLLVIGIPFCILLSLCWLMDRWEQVCGGLRRALTLPYRLFEKANPPPQTPLALPEGWSITLKETKRNDPECYCRHSLYPHTPKFIREHECKQLPGLWAQLMRGEECVASSIKGPAEMGKDAARLRKAWVEMAWGVVREEIEREAWTETAKDILGT